MYTYTVSTKSEPLNILQYQAETCTDLNENLRIQCDIWGTNAKFCRNMSFCLRYCNSFYQKWFHRTAFPTSSCRIRDVDHLRERLIENRRSFDQNIIDRALNHSGVIDCVNVLIPLSLVLNTLLLWRHQLIKNAK